MKKIFTLCYIQHYENDGVLLGLKKRGLGAGFWSGFGGKVEEGESIEAAMAREVKEEAGIEPLVISKQGILDFHLAGSPSILEVHVFLAKNYSGQLRETEEMKPGWFSRAVLPYDQMWPGDRHWLPLLLENKHFRGEIHYGEKGELLRHTLATLDPAS